MVVTGADTAPALAELPVFWQTETLNVYHDRERK